MATFELSEKKYKNGRRHFTAILYELQPPECVDTEIEAGTKYNKNGITFLEEYCKEQLESIKDMSVTVEFIDEERTQILGHGMTGIDDGMPTFDNATVVGHFTDGFIKEIETNGEIKKVVCGKGYLDEMRYHSFVAGLEDSLNNGMSIDGSIEIYKSEGNDSIVYKYGWKEIGRIPTEFIHSGWSMVLNPADVTSTLIELNSKKTDKEENKKMELNMEELKSAIHSTIAECNNKDAEFNQKIAELNEVVEQKDTVISEKEATITELNATIEQVKKALADLEAERDTYWAEKDVLIKELAELKAEKRIAEMNDAISVYSEEEQKCAEDEINAFKENPLESEICSITNKINAEIVANQKKAENDAKVAEQNSAKSEKENETIDIFSEMCSEENYDSDEDVNIF